MGINLDSNPAPIYNPKVDNTELSVDTDGIHTTAFKGKIVQATSDLKKSASALGGESAVQGRSLPEHQKTDELQETAPAEDVLVANPVPKSGLFGGLKIGAGKPSGATKGSMGNGACVPEQSLKRHMELPEN
ncbi:MAG: hypothetical protein LBR92_01505 [Puniceicoccales bacterium]|jgi:hypothetical protein|nr:hypothetical protein [Puniceicoccales bacterium]